MTGPRATTTIVPSTVATVPPTVTTVPVPPPTVAPVAVSDGLARTGGGKGPLFAGLTALGLGVLASRSPAVGPSHPGAADAHSPRRALVTDATVSFGLTL